MFLYRFSSLACAPLLFVGYVMQPVGGASYVERDSSLEVMEQITFSGNTLGFRTDSSWVSESWMTCIPKGLSTCFLCYFQSYDGLNHKKLIFRSPWPIFDADVD